VELRFSYPPSPGDFASKLKGPKQRPGESKKGVLLMIVVKTYKSNAWYLAGITTAIEWENCIKRLKYYFPDVNKVREKILAARSLILHT